MFLNNKTAFFKTLDPFLKNIFYFSHLDKCYNNAVLLPYINMVDITQQKIWSIQFDWLKCFSSISRQSFNTDTIGSQTSDEHVLSKKYDKVRDLDSNKVYLDCTVLLLI